MISVLIPVYNYKIQPLVENLLVQFESVNCTWEIFLADDKSDKQFWNENLNFIESLNLQNVKLFQQDVNVGNAANRNFLIEKATNEWLLFLDVDVLPVKDNFISLFISTFKSTSKDLVSGNIVYDNKNPKPHLLRWKYGKLKEEILIEERKKSPILNLRGANFAIRKSVALKFKMPILKEKYGFVDTRFFLQFKDDQVDVIENPVYHLGLEENKVYISKIKLAISNAYYLMDNNVELSKQLTLISSYKKIRIIRKFLAFLFRISKSSIERNLLSKNPSILVFQLFKILYLSHLDVVVNAK